MAVGSTSENFKNETNKNKENEIDHICLKFKRTLEVLSILCSTIGINILIACFLGASDVFGVKSPEISALGFMIVSAFLGILAMISSIFKNGSLQAIFSNKWLFIRIFTLPFCRRSESTAKNQEELNLKDPNSKIKETASVKPEGKKFVETSENSSDLQGNKIKENDDYCAGPDVKYTANSFWKKRPSEAISPLPLRKRRTPLLLGQCSVTQNSSQITKSSKFMLFDLDQNDERERLVPMIQETFMSDRSLDEHFTGKLQPRETCTRKPPMGIVNPYQIQNSNIGGQYIFPEEFDSTKENFNFSPKFNEKSKLEQQIFHGRQYMVHNTVMEDESPFNFQKRFLFQNPSNDMKDDSKFSSKMFNYKPMTSQVSPSRPNILRNTRSEDENKFDFQRFSFESPLDTKNIFSERLKIEHHVHKGVFCDEKCYSFDGKLGPFTKAFQRKSSHPELCKIPDDVVRKKGLHGSFASYMETPINSLQFPQNTSLQCNPKTVIPAHGMQNMDFEECNLQGKPVSPMDVCENLQSDKIFEVAMKLNEMNFRF